jgi:hypothetical protein
MGKKEIKMPTTPQGWAINLSQLVKIVHAAHNLDRFPIKVADIARDYTAQVFPDSPITLVEGRSFDKFEGALVPKPDRSGEWGILYNSAIKSSGRINFTLAHELGHYLLHRHLSGDPIFCGKRDMWKWESAYGQMEAQANEFASYLLMPLDDFRAQLQGLARPNVQFFEQLRGRYDVSVTAVILKWLEITDLRAMIVVGRDGFIDWARSSTKLLKSGVFFRARQDVIPLPEQSLANLQDTSAEALTGKILPEGVWAKDEPVCESVIHSEYHGMSISLLIYPKDAPAANFRSFDDQEDPEDEDVYERMTRLVD